MNEDKCTILYLMNPDPVSYGYMDQKVPEVLEKFGATLIFAELEQLSYIVSDDFQFYMNGLPIEFDAFLAYGYMAPKHYKDYCYFNFAVHAAGKVVLHTPETENILFDKLLQATRFCSKKIAHPKSVGLFSLQAAKDTIRHFPEQAIVKEVSGFCGNEVKLAKNQLQTLNYFSKSLWNETQSIIQKYIADSFGRSVRVVIVGGVAVSATEYIDPNDFRSNAESYLFDIASLMESDKKEQYFQLAEKACRAIDSNMTVGGVDILDSEESGLQVIEINSWPELILSQDISHVPLFDLFAQEFIKKIKNNKGF